MGGCFVTSSVFYGLKDQISRPNLQIVRCGVPRTLQLLWCRCNGDHTMVRLWTAFQMKVSRMRIAGYTLPIVRNEPDPSATIFEH